VHQHIAAWAGDRLDADGVASLVDRFLADPRIVLVSSPARRHRNRDEAAYTTTELLETEDTLLALCRQGRVERGGAPRAPVDTDHINRAIEAVNDRLRANIGDDARLSDEQSELIRQLLAGADLVRPVVGPAGTGKTEAMRAVVHGYTAAGYTVLATANGGRQAEELNERLEIPTQVVSGWLTRLDHSPDPAEAWPAGTVLIVDEATQVSTRDAERLLRYATRTGTVVVLVGDPVQLGSVGAGGWFRHLVAVTPDVPGLTVTSANRVRAWPRFAARSPPCARTCRPTARRRCAGSPPTAGCACSAPARTCSPPWSTIGTKNAAARPTPEPSRRCQAAGPG